MNRLEPEIIALRYSIQEIQSVLIDSNERGKEAEKNQEQLEHRVTLLEDLSVQTEERVKDIEDKVELLHKHLNAAITRINDLHKWLDSFTDKDLRCDEKLDVSDDSDEEFDLSDYNDKITKEIARVEQDQMAEDYRELSDNPE